jgi:prepilin-type N-terminal cleavage/methylation domain-containing protein
MKTINKKGFTLIELLVVIAIIGLLSTMAVVALNNARTKSRDAKRISDIKQIQTALEMYFTDHNNYPGGVTWVNTMGQLKTEGFFAQVPQNPTPNGRAYAYEVCNSTGTTCDEGTTALQTVEGFRASYTLSYWLEGGIAPVGPGVHCATPAGIDTQGGTCLTSADASAPADAT